MRDYELTVLFHPDLEMNLDPAIDKVQKIIESAGGKIVKTENDGKKHLAYRLDGQDYAVFYYLDVQLPTEAPLKISSNLNITDEVLRHLLVRADINRAKNRAAAAEAEAKSDTDSEAKSDSKTNLTEEKGD